MKSLLLLIYRSPVWAVCYLAFFLLLLWAGMNRIRPKGWQTVNRILIPLAAAGILLVTLSGRSTDGAHISYPIPFSVWKRALGQPEYYREMLMNCFLFQPFGMAFPYLLPKMYGTAERIVAAISAALILSAGIELIQYRLNLGSFETDDILCNASGALFGASHLLLAHFLPCIIDFFSAVGKRIGKDRK